MTEILCLANSTTLFTQSMNTQYMLGKVSALSFLDSWAGLTPQVATDVAAAIETMRGKGKFREPTVESDGTTLRDIMYLIPEHTKQVIHVILAANFYGVGGLRP